MPGHYEGFRARSPLPLSFFNQPEQLNTDRRTAKCAQKCEEAAKMLPVSQNIILHRFFQSDIISLWFFRCCQVK
jgi:hypothetical protein